MADQEYIHRDLIKEKFRNGDRPNQDDFEEVFENFINFKEDLEQKDIPVNFKNGLTISGGNDNPNLPNGTIRWDGNQFVQLKNGVWTTFGGSKWEEGNYNAIFYKGGDVGIGIDPNSVPGDTSKLVVDGKIYSKKDGFKFPDGSVQTSAATTAEVLWEKESGNSIHYDGGNVGIGTGSNVLNDRLCVNGSMKITESVKLEGNLFVNNVAQSILDYKMPISEAINKNSGVSEEFDIGPIFESLPVMISVQVIINRENHPQQYKCFSYLPPAPQSYDNIFAPPNYSCYYVYEKADSGMIKYQVRVYKSADEHHTSLEFGEGKDQVSFRLFVWL